MNTNDNFTHQTMLTYIGNKRKLVSYIEKIVQENVLPRVKKEKLNIFDGFAGSSVVSRSLSQFANVIHTNDMEKYSSVIALCFLETPNESMKQRIVHHIEAMNLLAEKGPYIEGVITTNYSPKDTFNVQQGERCFYTHENALIIDTLRKYISDNVEPELFAYCISPLLIKASIHTNTGGVFKGFYKDKETGLGSFGGSQVDDVNRITKQIKLDLPVWSENTFKSVVHNQDINVLIDELPDDFDLTYLDPPYNQHPYGSNYHMLNTIIHNRLDDNISKVAGIPKDWNRSDYNYEEKAITAMKDLIQKTIQKSKFILLSYNNEGIIPMEKWENIFSGYEVKKFEIEYDAYKASRNLKDRAKKVVEIMYLISSK
tara:strand:- start:192 stop:1304 length:1113 start_codon:yes stop_codon:yes gene_type:complete